MDSLYTLQSGKSRSICGENPTGAKGAGAMEAVDICPASSRLGKGWKCRPFITIPAKETAVLCDITGSGEITSMWITGEVDRGLILRMYWDDCDIPAVECPLTEFCGYGWAEPMTMENDKWNSGPYCTLDSALMSIAPNRGFSIYIPMPYRKGAKFTLENRSQNNKVVYYQINYEEKPIPESAGYFHAQFSVSMPVAYMDVHTLVDQIQGKGTYLGTNLYVGLNRGSRWWGEGEFKFYMDGDGEYPTICTTGLEDYFLGAFNWDCEGIYRPYSHLYCGMNLLKPDGQYNIQQRFSLYRWHVKDPIRFEENLKVTVQALGWARDDDGKAPYYMPREDDYLSVSYFYLDAPSTNLPPLIDHQTLTERF